MTGAPRARFGPELAILLAVGLAITFLCRLWLYPALGLPSHGPVPLRTVAWVLVITWFLRRGGVGWRDYGLRWQGRWWWLPLLVVAVLAGKIGIQTLTDALRDALGTPPLDYSFFADLPGSQPHLVVWLLIAWGVGGFAEEMVFRGYLLRRLAAIFGGARRGWTLALVAQAVVFGLGHSYVGWTAAVGSTFTALLFGIFASFGGRSLWPVIVAHGLWDTLGVVVIYTEGLPGG